MTLVANQPRSVGRRMLSAASGLWASKRDRVKLRREAPSMEVTFTL